MRRLLVLLALATVLAVPTGAADAQGAPPAAASTEDVRVVRNAAQYRQAIEWFTAHDDAPHTLSIAADIDVGSAPVPRYEGHQTLTVHGNGHTLRGSGGALLVGQQGSRLNLDHLTLTGAAAGIAWEGTTVIHDVRFVRLGRGHRLADVGPVLSVTREAAYPALVLLTDVAFVANRARISAITSAGRLTATRVTIRGNDSIGSTVLAIGRLRMVDVLLRGNLARHGPVIAARGDAELVGVELNRNHHLAPGTSTSQVVNVDGTLTLVRSFVHDNRPLGQGRGRVALDAADLVARRSVVHHTARACWITGTSRLVRSLVSDRSCRTT